MRGLLSFVRSRTLWLLALPPLFLAGLVAHELSHVAAARLLGGSIVELRLLPSFIGGRLVLGWTLHDGVANPHLVALAPTALWLVVATATAAATRAMRSPRRAARLAFLLIVVPLVDVSFAIGALLMGHPGDLSIAIAPLGPWIWPVLRLAVPLIFIAFGVVVHRRLEAAAPGALRPHELAIGFGALMLLPWALLV